MSFKDLQLITPLLQAIEEQGYTKPTQVQKKAIPFVLAKRDIITSAQTGTGKTAAFALPILQMLSENQEAEKRGRTIKALIVSPTRELALQIGNNFKAYGRHTHLRTTVIFGGTPIEPQIDVLTKGVDILVATPGRLIDLQKQEVIDLNEVEILVLDEADLMLDMGFIDDVKHVVSLCPKQIQILLFSATMPYKVEQLANTILNNPERIEIMESLSTANAIGQILYYVPKHSKIELCLHLLRNEITGSILIFRRTKFGVDKLEQTLIKNNYQVETLHGDKSQTDRQTALKKFKSGQVNILIATDVAARGIDINELDAVINFDLPNIPETYVHRIGRTGRAGNSGMSYSFCAADEKAYVQSIQQILHIQIPVEENHPYPLDPNAKTIIHKSNHTDIGSKHRKGRKSEASKKKKKRWY
ncbi:MAG: DEAD/DEAH box helicase [Xanthomarina sp.]